MKEHTSNERVVKVVGIDLAKRSFYVYGVDERGQRVISKTFTRTRLKEFMANLPHGGDGSVRQCPLLGAVVSHLWA